MLTSFVESHTLLSILLSPLTWVFLIALYVLYRVLSHKDIIADHYDKDVRDTYKDGQLFGNGSKATSQTESTYRDFLKNNGLPVLSNNTRWARKHKEYDDNGNVKKPGIAMKVPGPGSGLITPDIVVWFNDHRKVVVEVDPYFHHGRKDQKYLDDLSRNIRYAQSGYAIVRLRIGFKNTSPTYLQTLGEYDVIIGDKPEKNVYAPDMTDEEAREVLKAVRRAKVATKAEVKDWQDKRIAIDDAANLGTPDRLEGYKGLYPGERDE